MLVLCLVKSSLFDLARLDHACSCGRYIFI
jgi:hypothetical protein